MTNKESAEYLSSLLNKPSAKIDEIIKHLELDDFEGAKSIWLAINNELYQNVIMYRAMARIFGCKLHSKIDCKNWLCIDNRSLRYNPKEVTRKQ